MNPEAEPKQVLIRMAPDAHRRARTVAAYKDMSLREFVEQATLDALEREAKNGLGTEVGASINGTTDT